MMDVPWWISLKTSGVIAVLGVVVALLTYPRSEPAMLFFALAVLWMLATARSRRAYWNARLRARAAADEREYRQSKS
jgi:uncharacterized membrane protein